VRSEEEVELGAGRGAQSLMGRPLPFLRLKTVVAWGFGRDQAFVFSVVSAPALIVDCGPWVL
jgi:hypothetical protein